MRQPTLLCYAAAIIGSQFILFGNLVRGEDVAADQVEEVFAAEEDEDETLHGLFLAIDRNSDRKLDEAEVEEFFENMGSAVPPGLWAREDKNNDGFIEPHEFATGSAGDEL